MRIGVDAGCLGITDKQLQLGVYQVAVNFLKELKKQDTQNEYLLYSFSKIDKKLLRELGTNVKNIVVKPARGWTKIWLPLQLLKDKPDVFLGLNQALPMKLPLQTYRSILLVHDLLFEDNPTFYTDAKKLHSETAFAVKRADKIVTISQAVKKNIIEKYRIDQKNISVAYEGIRNFSNPLSASPKKKPYFLFVGAMKKSKNIPRLIEAFGKFASFHLEYEMILVGSTKWLDPQILAAIAKQPRDIKKRIYLRGFIDDQKLGELYSHATVFISPSLYEGFGLPFVEAMRFGLPIIASPTGATEEVVKNAGILVNPKSIEAIYKAMKTLVEDKKLYQMLHKNSLKQAKRFSWAQFTNTIYSIISSYEDTTR